MRFAPSFLYLPLAFTLHCSMSGAADDGPDGGRDVSDEEALRSIRFVEDGPIRLVYRQSFEYSVLVTDAGGPVAGARVDVALQDGQDASLDATVLLTGADGAAHGSLVAATVTGTSQLRAALPTGETALLELETSAPTAVRVTLDPLYEGERRVPAYDVELSPGATCPAVYRGPGDPGTTVTVTVNASDPSFDLPLALLYLPLAVSVVGVDGGVSLTWGCTDGVAVTPAGVASLSVVLADLPWPRPGTHPTTTRLLLGPQAAEVVRAIFSPVAAALDGATSPGALAIDGMLAAFDADGNAPAREVLAARRALDGLDAAVDAAMPEFAGVLREARDGAVAFLEAAWVEGSLDLGEVDAAGVAASVDRWIGLTDGTTAVPFAGVSGPALEAEARAVPSSSALELRQHEMPVSLARIVELAVGARLGDSASVFTGTLAARLDALVPCEALAGALAGSLDLLAVCDTACLVRSCAAWHDALVASADAVLSEAATGYASLALSARCGVLEPDGGLVDAGRCDGDATARWSGMAGGDLPPGPFTVDPSTP
ncbi:MAG: hypothetical protein HY907_07745 [Deltaproteobacteria bacterium]|nr:hypothetical protein [Deltaproteobacteria bacterium]